MAPGSVGVKHGIVLGGQHEGIIDSTIEEIVSNDGDSQAIGIWTAAGPLIIRNNFISSAGINLLSGGAIPAVLNLVPSDLEITHNHFYKPLKWKDDQAFRTGTNRVVVKNLFELKNAQRVLVEGNVFENVWPDAQNGYAIVLTPLPGGVNTVDSAWTIVSDVTFRNNLLKNCADGFVLDGGGPTLHNPEGPTLSGGRFLIENNAIVGLGGDYPSDNLSGVFASIRRGPFDLQLRHNTVEAYSGSTLRGITLQFTYGVADEGGALYPLQRFVVQDNIWHARSSPLILGEAGDNLSTVAPGYTWTNTVFVGPWPTTNGYGINYPIRMPQGNGNDYPSSSAKIGYSNLAAGDYRLAPGSPYKGAASDGRDIGVDWEAFDAAQGSTNNILQLSGQTVPSSTVSGTSTSINVTIAPPQTTTPTQSTTPASDPGKQFLGKLKQLMDRVR